MDVTNRMIQAAKLSRTWCPSDVVAYASRLASRYPAAELDWDQGAGENWCRVMSKGVVKALVCALFPFAVITGDYNAEGDSESSEEAVILVAVMDFDQSAVTVDRAALESLFGRPVSTEVDTREMSVNDLWWCTST